MTGRFLRRQVNLKEQGQLIRQDEFTVFFRKKKCVRRVFLFEELILFSKTKKNDVGNDVYVYKQSFKVGRRSLLGALAFFLAPNFSSSPLQTSDVGMTHNSSVSGLCFEIWFRRRKRGDIYTLKASSMDVKKVWTADLERILWDQAAHSRGARSRCSPPLLFVNSCVAIVFKRNSVVFQSFACRSGSSWGWAANLLWTFSPATLPSATGPSTASSPAEVSSNNTITTTYISH